MNILLWISMVWVISEIVLGILTRSRKSSSTLRDKYSLPILWIVIILSITLGVFLAAKAGITSFLAYDAGIFLILAGIVIRWLAIVSLKHMFTSNVSIQHNHALKTDGMYAWLRHPSYSGAILSFFGLGVSLGCWYSLLLIVVPITSAFLYRIKIEEEALLAYFGDEYRSYMKRTKKILPFLY